MARPNTIHVAQSGTQWLTCPLPYLALPPAYYLYIDSMWDSQVEKRPCPSWEPLLPSIDIFCTMYRRIARINNRLPGNGIVGECQMSFERSTIVLPGWLCMFMWKLQPGCCMVFLYFCFFSLSEDVNDSGGSVYGSSLIGLFRASVVCFFSHGFDYLHEAWNRCRSWRMDQAINKCYSMFSLSGVGSFPNNSDFSPVL